MNIFAIDANPQKAAIQLHDRHVVKMILESAQMICTTRRLFGDTNPILYKPCFVNHPCTVWARESVKNYIWLCKHFKALCEEYNYRYNRTHSCEKFLPILYDDLLNKMHQIEQTPFALAMPDKYKVKDHIQSYRNYYIGEKIKGNFWTKRCHELDGWLISNIKEFQFKKIGLKSKLTHKSI